MIAPAILDERPFVITRGTERTIRQIDRRENMVRWTARILNAEMPGMAILQAGDIQIAARLDHEVADVVRAEDSGAAVDRVPFSDPAQVDTHSCHPEERRSCRIVELKRAVVNQRQTTAHLDHVRHAIVLIVIEAPKVGQNAECHVEFPACPLADLMRIVQYREDVA